jgi:hypothetical protein
LQVYNFFSSTRLRAFVLQGRGINERPRQLPAS